VTDVPAQTGFKEAETDTLTGRFGLTVIVTLLEVAGLPLTHVAFEVKMQLITSPLTGEYV
jgi:hypothetical protein